MLLQDDYDLRTGLKCRGFLPLRMRRQGGSSSTRKIGQLAVTRGMLIATEDI